MEKFTKGPWQFTKCGPADSNGMGICSMWGDYESSKVEIDANSYLIAAAPEMYEMLKSFLCLEGIIKTGPIIDLLAKARGE